MNAHIAHIHNLWHRIIYAVYLCGINSYNSYSVANVHECVKIKLFIACGQEVVMICIVLMTYLACVIVK